MTKDNFLPKDHKIPNTSNYLNKFPEGDTIFRILSPAITGWEYFNNQNKPVRQKEEFVSFPDDIKIGNRIVYFLAFVIWNYEAKRVQILEVTQKTIMSPIQSLFNNPKWGDPRDYDLTISRRGSGMNDTEYTVTPNPKEKVSKEIEDAFKARKIRLEALYEGNDPFSSEKKGAMEKADYPEDGPDPSEIPF